MDEKLKTFLCHLVQLVKLQQAQIELLQQRTGVSVDLQVVDEEISKIVQFLQEELNDCKGVKHYDASVRELQEQLKNVPSPER